MNPDKRFAGSETGNTTNTQQFILPICTIRQIFGKFLKKKVLIMCLYSVELGIAHSAFARKGEFVMEVTDGFKHRCKVSYT